MMQSMQCYAPSKTIATKGNNVSETIDKIKTLTDKATNLKNIAEHIKFLKTAMETAEAAQKELEEIELPELMHDIGMQQFQLSDGTKFEVKPILVVNLPKDKAELADEWLDGHGHSGLVKTVIAVPKTVPRDELELLLREFHTRGWQYDVSKSIHWQTLQKWAREMESEGMVIPEDIFTVYRSMRAVITGG